VTTDAAEKIRPLLLTEPEISELLLPYYQHFDQDAISLLTCDMRS
jgi:hypothetical protein